MNKTIIAAIIISSASTLAYAGDHERGHHQSMKMFSSIDANSDESLSKEEVINFHTLRFTEMDADNDGLVSKPEIKSYKKQQRRDKKGSCDQKGSDTES